MDFGLVSIIMPAYNCQEYIAESIRSVINQTYRNWELIITDDCSIDKTVQIIEEFVRQDKRIRCYKNDKNHGAAMARNNSIIEAKGCYLAFLDADDIWMPQKLEVQLEFMSSNNIIASCTSYGKIDEKSEMLKKKCIARKRYEYSDMLKACPGNSTMIYNCEKLGKIEGPNIEKRNDLAMFLQVIKKAKYVYGLQDVLGYHRLRNDGLSSNKMQLVFFQWKVYNEIEHLGGFKSSYYIVYKMIQTLLDRNG